MGCQEGGILYVYCTYYVGAWRHHGIGPRSVALGLTREHAKHHSTHVVRRAYTVLRRRLRILTDLHAQYIVNLVYLKLVYAVAPPRPYTVIAAPCSTAAVEVGTVAL